MGASDNRYQKLIEKVFFDHYSEGDDEVPFVRGELEGAANDLGIRLPKNLGDVVYSIRYRTPLPSSVAATQPVGKEWVIEGMGRSSYCFRLVKISRIVPNLDLVTIKIPDATPEIVSCYSLSDEQALLAKIRYNRIVDLFLGMVSYSLQNHLRTTVDGIGQIEVDELYVGLDQTGCQYVVPVQAKGGSDQISVVQARQDMQFCNAKFPSLVCRSVSAQFMDGSLIAMFELAEQDGHIRVAQEKHYRLVPVDEIGADELAQYRVFSGRR